MQRNGQAPISNDERAVTRVLMAWSGGKDSAMALDALREDPSVHVVGLLTSVTSDYDRVSIHGIRREILRAQAAALGVPIIEVALRAGADNAAYERVWSEGFHRAQSAFGEITAIAYGDIFLADVRAYRERLAAQLGVGLLFPLWGCDTRQLAVRFAERGHEAYVCCVDTEVLSQAFAGRRYDAAFVADLPPTIDACGERGEFHTCVSNGPSFSVPLQLRVGDRVLRDNRFEYCDLTLCD